MLRLPVRDEPIVATTRAVSSTPDAQCSRASTVLAAIVALTLVVALDVVSTGLRRGFPAPTALLAFACIALGLGVLVGVPLLLLRRELLARVVQPNGDVLRETLAAGLDVWAVCTIAGFEALRSASDLERGVLVTLLGLGYAAVRVVAARRPGLRPWAGFAVSVLVLAASEALPWRLMDRTRGALDLIAVALLVWSVGGALRAGLHTRRILYTTLVLLVFAIEPLIARSSVARAWLTQESAHARSVRYLLVPLLDWDGDGAPVALGGRDCAWQDPEVYPGAHERLQNGVDDNCMQGDGLSHPASTTARNNTGATARDVLLLSIDALRWDATHALVHTRAALGPHLTLTNAVSPAPRTIDSMAATLRGRPVRQLELSRHEALRIHAPLRDTSPTLADVLVRHGYRAMFVPSHRYLDASTRIAAGFESLVTPGYAALHTIRPGIGKAEPIVRSTEIFERLLAELRATPQDKPVLAWGHLMETHHPYYWGAEAFGPDDKQGYLRAIEHIDQELARFLLEAARIRERAPITVVFGDHGEELGEHGGFHHATSVYAEQARVGLLITGPNVPSGKHDGPIATTALPATLLELLGLPPGPFVEPSLVACARSQERCPEVAVSELRHKGRYAVGYTTESHRLIYNPVYDVEELFDRHRDPYERTNLNESALPALAKLRALARRWDEQH